MAARFDCVESVPQTLGTLVRLNSDVLALPFDVAREQYAKSVRAGLVERSLLASARFERTLSALETLTLGVMARRC
jgi:hypothetical protein